MKIKRICKKCKSLFYTTNYRIKTGHGKYCSKKCYDEWQSRNKIEITCIICDKTIKYPLSSRKRKYCSSRCRDIGFSKKQMGKNNYNWKGGGKDIKCKNCNKKFYVLKAEIDRDGGKFCSSKCFYKWVRGENHPNWKGGISKRKRESQRYRNWKNKVFKRDNWKCQLCGNPHPYKNHIEAHHLKNWKDYSKLRYTLYNGITLCLECHYSNR